MNLTAKLNEIRTRAQDAIRTETGAVVELTPSRGNGWTVSGQSADVRTARRIMRAAGLRLVVTEFDAEYPGEQFDRYAS